MRSYKDLRDLFLQNVFYSKLNCLLDQHLKTLIQSFVNEHTGEILSYAVSLANDHNDKTQQLINLIAGVENAQELNDLYCDAEVCLAIGPDDKLDKEVIEDLNANFIKNLDEIEKLLAERALTIPFPLEVTSTPLPMVRSANCIPVKRHGLVPVAEWTRAQRLDQEACSNSTTSLDSASTASFGSTTSLSDTDGEDKGLNGVKDVNFSSGESLESLTTIVSNSSGDVSALNSSADFEGRLCVTPAPHIEDVQSKRQGLERVENLSEAELEKPFGETKVDAGFSFF
jgi:hypothetical protein